MTDRRAGAIAAMILLAALVWIVTAGPAWPVRVYTTFLLVVLPMMAVAQVPLAEEDPTALPRMPLYASSAVALWILALGALAAAVIGGLPPRAIGLAPVPTGALVGWSLGTLAAALVLALLGHALGIRESAILKHMLPRTGRERVAFIGLSLSAGVCEELVFRGFLIPALETASGSLAVAVLFRHRLRHAARLPACPRRRPRRLARPPHDRPLPRDRERDPLHDRALRV